jgi:hypothetical protein
MGLFWDLLQQSQIDRQRSKTSTLEERIAALENDIADLRRLLQSTLKVLEEVSGKDIDADGRIG